jgi:hypothetical protein
MDGRSQQRVVKDNPNLGSVPYGSHIFIFHLGTLARDGTVVVVRRKFKIQNTTFQLLT